MARVALEMPQKQRDSPDLSSATCALVTEPTGWMAFSVHTGGPQSVCFTLTLMWACVCIKVFPKLGRSFQNNYMDNFLVEKDPKGNTSVNNS